jgi:hypothetical protein
VKSVDLLGNRSGGAMERRLRTRHHDASDASPEVLAQQLGQDARPMDWMSIDAGAGPADCLSAARRALGLEARARSPAGA